LALLAKFSALWLALLFPLWALVGFCRRREVRGRAAVQFLLLVVASWLVLGAGYRFQGRLVRNGADFNYAIGCTPLGEFPFVSATLTRPRIAKDGPPGPQEITAHRLHNEVRKTRINRFRGTFLENLPVPLPYEFLRGFDDQKWEAEGKYQQYLRGEMRRSSWWYYYLVALAIKLPLGSLLLLALSPIGLFAARRSFAVPWLETALLAAVPILAMTVLSDINLGLRYVLPALPFLFALAGAALAGSPPRWLKIAAIVAIGWNAAALARIHPNELAYFNETIGGPANGRYWLIDSNLDWGQDVRKLGVWLEKHPEWKDARMAIWSSLPTSFNGVRNSGAPPRS
ncbi:MAG TPA: hypothetical protein VNC50_05640, partial [Planctomycetia bacterium]|nr:hypothetical protein [Planctomycetia bacterium]